MKFSELVCEKAIVIGWPAQKKRESPTKWHLIEDLFLFLKETHELGDTLAQKSYEAIIERERSLSTGLGSHVALPHASVAGLPKPLGVCCLLKEGIDFESIDLLPAKIIVMLLMPKGQFERHIRTLAGIAQLMNDQSFRDGLLEAKNPREAYTFILSYEEKQD
ncbi:MAG: PTS sugar transporter subunit IIA [Leptospiraceae bacterium]|nr:PTS sugar transporter subunit IIA [Leptospiraceae bacterium]MDW8305943.1 PTS sugar transporter subunit IIA [Leptospiraceae bacterium]